MGAEYYLKNDDLSEYFISLPPIVQDQIVVSGAEICTLGELMQVAEHFKAELRMGREMDESFPS